jgi:uncharacterized SAM-binding protein YcdF (DUF218 family)
MILRRSLNRGILVGVFIVFVVGAAGVARAFVWPHQRIPARADAIVVFAGGDGERVVRGLDLAEAGVAPILVISEGIRVPLLRNQAEQVCSAEYPFEVVCFVAYPESTRGEAQMFAELAATRGWRDLVAVTSRSHLTRAGLVLDRCHDGTIYPVAAEEALGFLRLLRLVLHELGGMAEATFLERGC